MGLKARPGLLRRKSFEHEREVRGLIYFIDHTKFPNPKSSFLLLEYFELVRSSSPPGIGVHVDLKDLIEEIYISPLATSYFKEVIQILTERHGMADRIRISKLAEDPVW